ncbi:hypothetical protein EGW08_019037, partial [Elysia chlorotica]
CPSWPTGFPNYGPEIAPVLISLSDFSESYACGMCLQIATPVQEELILVRVEGVCDICEKGDIVFATHLFSRTITTTTNVTFQAAICPTVGTMQAYVFSRTNTRTGRVHMRVHNSRYPVTRMQIRRTETGEWEKMLHTTDAHFLYAGEPLQSNIFWIRTYAYNGLNLVAMFTSAFNELPYVGGQQVPVLDDHVQFFQDPGPEEEDPYAARPGETNMFTAPKWTWKGVVPVNVYPNETTFTESSLVLVGDPAPKRNTTFSRDWLRGGPSLKIDVASTTPSPTNSRNLTNYALNGSLGVPLQFNNDNNDALGLSGELSGILAAALACVCRPILLRF